MIHKFIDRLRYFRAFMQDRVQYAGEALRDSLFPINPRSILIIRDRGYGDIVRTVPLLEKFKRKYPEAELFYLTDEPFDIAVKHSPLIKQVFIHEDAEDVCAREFDFIVNLQIFDNSNFVREILPRLKGRRFWGSQIDRNGHYHLQEICTWRTWMERFCRIAHLPYSLDDSENVRIALPANFEDDEQNVLDLLGPRSSKPRVALALGADDHPGGSGWYRNYSLDFLLQLAEHLSSDYDFILVGQSDDRNSVDLPKIEALAAIPGVRSLVDKLTLWDLHLALKNCNCLVTCDTGPLHIAMAMGTPVVGLFGQTTASIVVSPRKETAMFTLFQSDRNCSPCEDRIDSECRRRFRAVCMDSFDLDAISRAVAIHTHK